MKKKTIALVLACIICVGIGVGGTLAWLTATDDSVTNTFTTSDINIELEETTGNSYKMVPGYTITKDPNVTVAVGSEECYLFVKLEKSSNFDDFMSYTMAEGWTQLEDASGNDVAGVFYRVIHTADMGSAINVLANNQVTVSGSVTKADMTELSESDYPTLTVTAYASQLYKNSNATGNEFTAIEAWNNVFNPSGATT